MSLQTFLRPDGANRTGVSKTTGLPTVYADPIIDSGEVTLTGTGRSSGENMGGLITVNGFTPNTKVTLSHVGLTLAQATAPTVGNASLFVFEGAPAGTFTDGAAPTLTVADAAKIVWVGGVSALSAAIVGLAPYRATFGAATGPVVTADESGNIYMVLQAAAAFSSLSTCKLYWRVEGRQ